MLRLMSMRLLALAAGCVLLAGCSSGGADVVGGPVAASGRTSATPFTTSPSPYPWTDCNAIRPGDPLDYSDTRCNSEELEYFTVDCVNGTYVHLSRPGIGDLEGIDGVTPWRAAKPIDPKRGGTCWAFENCKEHDT